MNYSPDGFQALHESVEHHGGALLPDPCEPQDVVRTVKEGYIRNKTDRKTTCGCGNLSKFVIPYVGEEGDKRAHFCNACAVCDAIGAWPLFVEDVIAADPDMDPMLDERDDAEGEDEDGS
jgi:hypothetical protein